MDYSVFLHKTLPFLPYKSKLTHTFPPNLNHRSFFGQNLGAIGDSCTSRFRNIQVILAKTGGPSSCEYSSSALNTPLEPISPAGKFLSRVLQNQRQHFNLAVSDELKQLANDRDSAVRRMVLSSGSDEASLYRRIAQLKDHECQTAVEDVMYMLLIYKFSEIGVSLVPKLSKCIYNRRLEIWPSKDWELESIYSFEVLEMIREHITAVIGLRANSSVTDNWATTQIQLFHLGRVYTASILYGYFLKSASLRYDLERSLSLVHQDFRLTCGNPLHFPEMWPYGFKNLVFGGINNTLSVSSCQGASRQELKQERLKCYLMGFDPETLQRCAKLRCKETVNLIEKHSCALFGDGQKDLLAENDEMIVTSFSSLKRLVLEAITFGSFLWATEQYVDAVYKLKEN